MATEGVVRTFRVDRTGRTWSLVIQASDGSWQQLASWTDEDVRSRGGDPDQLLTGVFIAGRRDGDR